MTDDVPDAAGKPSGAEKLPAELYPIIISFMPRSDLPAIMRVSSTFYPIAARLLYTSLDVDLSRGVGPFELTLSPITATPDSDHVSHSPLPNPSIPLQPGVPASLPSRFNHTTHLTLTSHASAQCSQITPLLMPNLISLRIRPVDDNDNKLICHCRKSPSINRSRPFHVMSPCRRVTTCHCSLIDQLRPSQLVLCNMQTGLTGSAFAWPSPTSSIPPFVEELAVVVWAVSQLMGEQAFFQAIPPTVKRLTLVVQRWRPRTGSAGEGEDGWETESEEGDQETALSFVGQLWSTTMSQALQGAAQGIEVVGYEGIVPEWTAEDVAKQIAGVRRELKGSLVMGAGWSEEKANTRAASVSFVTGKEHVREASGADKVVRDVVREYVIEGKESGRGGASV